MKHISKKVPNKSNSPLFKPTFAAVLSVFCSLSPSMVKASCIGLNTANVSCTGTDTSFKSTQTAGSSTVQLTDWTLSNGYFSDISTASGAQTLTANNIDITSSITTLLNVSSLATQGDINVQITDSILTSNGTGSGMSVMAQGTGSSSTGGIVFVNLTDTTINAGNARAVEVFSNNGDASLEMMGTNASSSGGIFVASGLNGGDVNVAAHGGTVTTTGNYFGADGFALRANGLNSKLTIDNSNTINTGMSGIATTGKNALTSVTNSGAINGAKLGSASEVTAGIYSTSIDGDIQIDNQGAITVSGTNNSGIFAQITGTGNASVSNSNNVTINGPSTALRVETNTGNATINQNGGNVQINGAVGNGAVYAMVNGSGNALINMNAGTVINNSTSNDAHGLESQARGTGDTTIHLNAGSVTTAGGLGIVAWGNNTGTGNATVTTGAGTTISATGSGANAGGIAARGGSSVTGTSVLVDSKSVINATRTGIKADSLNGGNIKVVQTGGSITSGATGIYTRTTGTGNIEVKALGSTINTSDAGSYGIYGFGGAGTVDITNTGNIMTRGTDAAAIYAETMSGGDIIVINDGEITTQDSRGIVGWGVNGGGDVVIQATNNITTGRATATTHNHGIDAGVDGNGNITVNYSNGTIKAVGAPTGGGNTIGIVAWDRATGAADVNATINLGANAIVDASEGVSGLQMRVNGTGIINISNTAEVHGGVDGIEFVATGTSAATHQLNNEGLVDSMIDRAIFSNITGSLSIENKGTIDGNFLMIGNEDDTFINHSSGSWNIRNFADTDGDLVRDTKAVAISNFGAGNDVVKNEATGTIRLAAVTGETTVNAANEYITAGALSINNAGIV